MVGREIDIPAEDPRNPGVPADIVQQYAPTSQHTGPQSAARHIPRSIVALPLEVVPPPEAVMFNPYGTATTVGAGQTQTLWAFRVPRDSVLIIKSLDLYATNTTTATQLQFGIFANGAPYGQFGVIPLFSGVAVINSLSFNEQTFRFGSNILVECRSLNTDGASYVIAARAQGWYFSSTIEDQYKIGIGAS